MDLILAGILSLGSAMYFLRLAKKASLDPNPATQPYASTDAIFASVLVIWFLMNIVGSANRVVVVDTRLLILGAIFSLLLTAFLLSFLVLRSRNPIALFGLSGTGWRQIALAAFLGLVAALPAIYFVHSLSLRLLAGDAQPQPLLQFLAGNSDLQGRLLLIVTAVLIAPISEEVIFRGYLFGVLRRYAGPWWAMIISSSIFAAIHAHIPSLAGLFVLAITLTLVYQSTGSLWAPILMHGLFNSLTVMLTLAWPESVK